MQSPAGQAERSPRPIGQRYAFPNRVMYLLDPSELADNVELGPSPRCLISVEAFPALQRRDAMASFAARMVSNVMWLSLGTAAPIARASPPADAGTRASTGEKVSCGPGRPAPDEGQLPQPLPGSAPPRSTAQIMGTRLAWWPTLQRCYRLHPLPATEPPRSIQLSFSVGRDGALSDLSVANTHSREFSACLARALAPLRHPPACETMQISL